MSRTVLVHDYYYRDHSGNQRVQRWIGDQCVYDETSSVVIVDWWNLKSVWATLIKLPIALVKEGPKAMVKYERWAVEDPYLDFLIFMHDMWMYREMAESYD
jgi:hypothetical protein